MASWAKLEGKGEGATSNEEAVRRYRKFRRSTTDADSQITHFWADKSTSCPVLCLRNGMLRTFVVLAAVVVAAQTACPTWPNTTETKTNWWMCSSGPMIFTDAQPTDCKGTYEYPIHLSAPLLIKTQANNPKNVYSSPGLKQTIKVWSWNTASCGWTSVPTFGLLNNLDACTNGVPCPIPLGQQTLNLELDFSDAQPIINLLKDDSPYQIQYALHDDVSGDDACLVFQARTLMK